VALSLFQNFSILVAVISITLEFVRSSKVQYQSPIVRRFVLGTVGGLIGILLLMSTVPMNAERTIIFDFRFVVMYLSAMYGGFISSIITSVIIAFYRIVVTGANFNAIVVSTSILICGILLGALSHLKASRGQKFVIMNIVVSLSIIIASFFIFDDFNLFLINSFMFTSTTVITSYFICRYINFSVTNIRNFWQLKIDATTDHLTELANLREFENRFEQLFEECQSNKMPISFLMLDLDHFKTIVLPRCPKETALNIGRRIRQQIEDYTFCRDSHEIRMTVSIGVSSSPSDTDDSEKLMTLADAALYKAKAAGRNAVMFAQ